MTSRSALSRRAAALALALAVVTLVLASAGSVYGRIAQRDAQIAERTSFIVRLRRVVRDAAGLEKAIARFEAEAARGELVLTAPSDRVATANLQQRLKTIVERAGGTLTSARVLESEQVEAFRRVGLEVRASLGPTGLRDTLHALESGSPMLLVENLTVVSRRSSRRRARTNTRPLDVRFRLVGYMSAPMESDTERRG